MSCSTFWKRWSMESLPWLLDLRTDDYQMIGNVENKKPLSQDASKKKRLWPPNILPGDFSNDTRVSVSDLYNIQPSRLFHFTHWNALVHITVLMPLSPSTPSFAESPEGGLGQVKWVRWLSRSTDCTTTETFLQIENEIRKKKNLYVAF